MSTSSVRCAAMATSRSNFIAGWNGTYISTLRDGPIGTRSRTCAPMPSLSRTSHASEEDGRYSSSPLHRVARSSRFCRPGKLSRKEDKKMEKEILAIEAAASEVELDEHADIDAIEESFAPALSSN